MLSINSKQEIIMPKKGEYITRKNLERMIKSTFMIYADFKSILVLEDNGKMKMSLILTNTKNMLLVVMVIE